MRACAFDFGGHWDDRMALIEFAYNHSFHSSIKMAPYEALYEKKCRSSLHWDDVGEKKLLGPELVQDAREKIHLIKGRLKAAQDRQKSWTDRKRRELKFQVGDYIFLKVSLMKGIMRFGKHGKLSPCCIGPFEVLSRIEDVAYKLALPPKLSKVHNVFHISLLRKYVPDLNNVVEYEPL